MLGYIPTSLFSGPAMTTSLAETLMSTTKGSPSAQPRTLRGRSSAETRSAVLDLIRSARTISRVELARRSALTEATISKITKELLGAGLVERAGYADSTGGKRAVLLRLAGGGVHALGVTLDVSRCVIVLCGADGAEVARSEVRGTGQDEPLVALRRLAGDIEVLLSSQRVDRSSVIGLGVAAPGARRGSALGWTTAAALQDEWDPIPVAEELSALTGLTVLRENDADCAALGEYWASSEATRDFVTVYMSYGIGAGIVVNGAIYRGASGNAGEIGHTVVDPAGLPCWCGSRGCLETVASPRAIVREALGLPRLRASLAADRPGLEPGFSELYRRFAERAADGDREATSLLDQAVSHFAVAVGNLVNTLDLDLVVLAGSGFAGVAEAYLCALQDRLRTTAFMRDVHPITIRLAATGPETAALGAASVVLHRHLTPHRSAVVA